MVAPKFWPATYDFILSEEDAGQCSSEWFFTSSVLYHYIFLNQHLFIST